MTEHWVQICSNQKEIKYISQSNIRATVETRLPRLHNLQFFKPQRLTYTQILIESPSPPPPLLVTPFWKPRSPWEEEEPLELERSRDCGLLVRRRQRNNNWTRQKNRESFVFTIRKVISPFPVLNTPENLTDFLRNALL